MNNSRQILIDSQAKSADPAQPAFVARPEGAPVYHGFPVIPETNTDGWIFGAITEFIGEQTGDGYVVPPDGKPAGLVWEIGEGVFDQILPPSPDRWGVYAVWFPRRIQSIEDLVSNFRAILPELKAAYEAVKG